MNLNFEDIRRLFMGLTLIIIGVLLIKAPISYFRGYDAIKENDRAIKRLHIVKKIVGYIFITVGIAVTLLMSLIILT